ncbi:MAG: hypothetical protein KatS3mg062_0261 [Tepidiforma sp.]|nr:MAG: hypothetical protein KatS3mg062_0261 [Tepidiforma sp.]
MTVVRYRSLMPVSPQELFDFHADVRNLQAISPPLPPFRLVEGTSPTRAGDLQVFRLGWNRLGVDWYARITRVVPGQLIEDTQERGPFLRWRHQHRFLPGPDGSSWLEDVVGFRLLPTVAGEFVEWLVGRPMLLLMFRWRHWRTRRLVGADRKS